MAATLQMLQDAQAALHELLTGARVAEFKDQNGETVRYSATRKQDLIDYIAVLKKELGIVDTAPAAGPMRVWF